LVGLPRQHPASTRTGSEEHSRNAAYRDNRRRDHVVRLSWREPYTTSNRLKATASLAREPTDDYKALVAEKYVARTITPTKNRSPWGRNTTLLPRSAMPPNCGQASPRYGPTSPRRRRNSASSHSTPWRRSATRFSKPTVASACPFHL